MSKEELNESVDSPNNEEALKDNSSDEYGSETETTDEGKEQGKSTEDSEIEQLRRDKAELEEKLKEKSIKARIANKKAKESGEEESSHISPEKVTKALLAAKGVTEKDEIEFVTGLAKKIGQDPDDAVDDDYVKFKLESYRKDKSVENATPSASNKGTATQKGVDWYIVNDKLPKDKEMQTKVRDELKRRAKSGA